MGTMIVALLWRQRALFTVAAGVLRRQQGLLGDWLLEGTQMPGLQERVYSCKPSHAVHIAIGFRPGPSSSGAAWGIPRWPMDSGCCWFMLVTAVVLMTLNSEDNKRQRSDAGPSSAYGILGFNGSCSAGLWSFGNLQLQVRGCRLWEGRDMRAPANGLKGHPDIFGPDLKHLTAEFSSGPDVPATARRSHLPRSSKSP